METMSSLVRRVWRKHGIKRPSEFAGLMGLSRAAISAHKSGRAKHFSEESAIKIADLLGEDKQYVLLCLAIERAKSKQAKNLWLSIASGLNKTRSSGSA